MEINLRVYQDEDVLLRCKGRLENSPLPFCTKFPILIPKNSCISEMIMWDAHRKVCHNGPRDTLCEVRSEYWIPGARQVLRQLIRTCVTCRKWDGKAYTYPMSPSLPSFRLSNDFAFNNIGIDYAGPLYVKDIYSDTRDVHKAWIALITCASSRALYLDIASDLSGEACVKVLKRFYNRKGAPEVINSDNGSNFISDKVQAFLSDHGTKWCFNVPSAPWQGGYFERMVQSVKRCLKKVLSKALVNYEELLTILLGRAYIKQSTADLSVQ